MLDHVKDELNVFRKRVIQQAKSNLTKRRKNASNDLYNSLSSDLNVSKNSFELAFNMTDYGQFVDKGVKGRRSSYAASMHSPFSFKNKRPPSSVFEKWIRQKGIKGVSKDGKRISDKSLAFLIARSVHQRGLKASLFFTKPFENEFKKLSDDIVEAFGLDVDEFLKYTLNNYE